MRIGLIGVGIVGGTLKKWFEDHTTHELKCYDPGKNLHDDLTGIEAAFISVPVPASGDGQNQTVLQEAVAYAKQFTNKIFIRSTVLPGTNDMLGTSAMPEFLTERRAYADMCSLPLLFGQADKNLVDAIFPNKEKIFVSNTEAELAKFTHNCFGAFKVTYFNVIHKLCEKMNADFQKVKYAAGITKFIEPTHTQVPGPDGLFGYGGKCFPQNMEALRRHLFFAHHDLTEERKFFESVEALNVKFRGKT